MWGSTRPNDNPSAGNLKLQVTQLIMFNRRKNQVKHAQIDTLIGAGTRVHGDLEFTGGLHLDGVVEGNVVAVQSANSRLSISNSGSVQGSISVGTLILNGLVQGDITASTRVELGSTAKVNGNVYYGLIEMAMGAQINGKLIHKSAAADNKANDPTVVTPVVVVDIGNTAKSKLG